MMWLKLSITHVVYLLLSLQAINNFCCMCTWLCCKFGADDIVLHFWLVINLLRVLYHPPIPLFREEQLMFCVRFIFTISPEERKLVLTGTKIPVLWTLSNTKLLWGIWMKAKYAICDLSVFFYTIHLLTFLFFLWNSDSMFELIRTAEQKLIVQVQGNCTRFL